MNLPKAAVHCSSCSSCSTRWHATPQQRQQRQQSQQRQRSQQRAQDMENFFINNNQAPHLSALRFAAATAWGDGGGEFGVYVGEVAE